VIIYLDKYYEVQNQIKSCFLDLNLSMEISLIILRPLGPEPARLEILMKRKKHDNPGLEGI